MPRFTGLLVSLVVVLAFAGCSKRDPGFCATGVCDAPPMVMDVDADPPQQACDDNTDCKQPGLGVCELDEKECVQCIGPDQISACKGATPVCNASFTCEACRVSADCPLSGVCLPSGACLAETEIAYVDKDGSDNATCSKAMPCTRIQAGLAAKTAGAPRPYLKLKGEFDEAVVINRSVTILAEPGASLTRGTSGPIMSITGASVVEINDLLVTASQEDGDPGIITSGTSELTLKRVTISQSEGNGITCAGKSLTVSSSTVRDSKLSGIACTAGNLNVSSSTIAGNDLLGISCTAGKATISSSIITSNEGGGIALGGASFDITNTFVVRNGAPGSGTSGSAVGGVEIPSESVAAGSRFEFNTIVDNHIKQSSFGGGITCDLDGFTAANNIIARNDVNGDLTRTNSNTFGLCTYPTSSILQAVTTLNFVSADSDPRDYHLKTGSVAIGQATTASTVTVDADGDARPQGAGNDQGADELKTP